MYVDEGITGTNIYTLPTIKRASGASASGKYLGDPAKINISRETSAFTHTITYSFGGVKGTIATKSSSTSFTWTP